MDLQHRKSLLIPGLFALGLVGLYMASRSLRGLRPTHSLEPSSGTTRNLDKREDSEVGARIALADGESPPSIDSSARSLGPEQVILQVRVRGLTPDLWASPSPLLATPYVEYRTGVFRPLQNQSLRRSGDEGLASFVVQAQRRLFVYLGGAGLRVSTFGREIQLQAGETRELIVDLSKETAFTVQLTGLEPALFAGRWVQIAFLTRVSDRGGGVPLSLKTRRARTDATGIVTFRGLPVGSVTLALSVEAGRRPLPLVDATTGAASWSILGQTYIEVRIGTSVIGVRPVDENSLPLAQLPFSLMVSPSLPGRPIVHAADTVLVDTQGLDSESQLLIRSPHGFQEVALGQLLPLGETLRGFRTPALLCSGGIRVILDRPRPQGLSLDFLRQTREGLRPLIQMQRARLRTPLQKSEAALAEDSFGLLAEDTGLLLQGLPPGEYRLAWTWDGGIRQLPGIVPVESGQITEVQLDAPLLVQGKGSIEGWSFIDPALRPHTVILDEQPIKLDGSGHLEFHQADPRSTTVWYRGPGMLVWGPSEFVSWDEDAGELTVRCSIDRLRTIEIDVPTVADGRIVADVHADPGETFGPASEEFYRQGVGDHLTMITAQTSRRTVEVWEVSPSQGHLLRGWARLGESLVLLPTSFAERWVEMAFDFPGALVELTARPVSSAPDGPEVAKLGTFDTSGELALWLPATPLVITVTPLTRAANAQTFEVTVGPGPRTLRLSVPR